MFCVLEVILECKLLKIFVIVNVLLLLVIIKVLFCNLVLVLLSSVSVLFFFVICMLMLFLMLVRLNVCIGWLSFNNIKLVILIMGLMLWIL